MCRPDVIGLNHYLTSDRFVDDRLERYPEAVLGGNGREPYADVTANRVAGRPSAGFAGALRDAWHRYQAPVAVTEVHNGSTRATSSSAGSTKRGGPHARHWTAGSTCG